MTTYPKSDSPALRRELASRGFARLCHATTPKMDIPKYHKSRRPGGIVDALIRWLNSR